MKMEEGALKVNPAEINALSEHLGLRRGALAVFPQAGVTAKERQDVARAFNAMEASSKKLYTGSLRTLNSPGKVIQLNYALGEMDFGRMLLAWSPDGGDSFATLVRAGDEQAVGSLARGAAQDMISGFLAAGLTVREDKIRVPLPTEVALALLAACDHLRRERLTSLLAHEMPGDLFTADDVRARFEDASAQDDRWPLNFVEKFLPIPMGELGVAKDPRGALGVLVQTGFLEAAGGDALFSFTEKGRLISDSLLRDASKVGLAVTALTPERMAAQDAVLLVRTADHILSFYMSGAESLLEALGPGDLTGMLGLLLGPVPVPPEQPTLPVGEAMEATIVPGAKLERTMVEDSTIDLVPLCLVVEGGAGEGKSYVLVNGGTLGRAPDNDILITDPGVSRKHATFTRAETGTWVVTDLGSANGTYVNGAKIKEPTPIDLGDEVRVCNTTLRSVPANQ